MENREILFRGKSVDNRKWVHGGIHYPFLDIAQIIHSQGINLSHFTQVFPETVGQFTGLTDKNGNKIFEGDIVKWDDESNGKYWRIAEVKINPSLCFDCSSNLKEYKGIINSSFKCYEYGNFIYRNTEKHLEIIGNIHDKI